MQTFQPAFASSAPAASELIPLPTMTASCCGIGGPYPGYAPRVKRVLTAREREIVDLAAGLAAEFAERASEHDRENTFPFENWPRMQEAGYLTLTVPQELGGYGASLHE